MHGSTNKPEAIYNICQIVYKHQDIHILLCQTKKRLNDISESDELSVLNSMEENEPKKAFKPIKKIRIDLVIFGILIYILGIFTGLFIGVGLSQGDLSLNSFQRFFSSADQVQMHDLGNNQTGMNANHGIVINNAASVNSGSSSVSGGGSGGGSGSKGSSGSSESSVTQVSDTSSNTSSDSGSNSDNSGGDGGIINLPSYNVSDDNTGPVAD